MIYLSKRENQIYNFFKQNDNAIIEEVAIAFTKESRQNLYNPGFNRLKQLGMLVATDELRLTTNGGSAHVYVRGPNFEKEQVINPQQKAIIKEMHRLQAELGGVKAPTKAKAKAKGATKAKGVKSPTLGRPPKYTTAKGIFRALRDGELKPQVYYNTVGKHSGASEQRKAMYREGHALWKQWKKAQRG